MARLRLAVRNVILNLFGKAERMRFTVYMFGYITINKAELKFREFDLYQAYYCGLCEELKKRYGRIGQATLTYDMTFLLLLFTGLYEPKEITSHCRCLIHPIHKHPVLTNEFTAYVADMNIVLSYYKCKDDWMDEHNFKKRAAGQLLKRHFHQIQMRYPKKVSVIQDALSHIADYEKKKETNLDLLSGCFGTLMAEIFVYHTDEWEESLRNIGYYLGKFVYLLDAYEDIEQDQKKGAFNPLLSLFKTSQFESFCQTMLTMMMAECSRLFEQLPILNYVSILRNILYSGVWQKYEAVKKQRSSLSQQEKGR